MLNPVIWFYVKGAIIRRVNSSPTLIPESTRRRVPSAFNRFFGARRKRGMSAKQIGREWRSKKRGRTSSTKRRPSTVRRRNSNPRRTSRMVRKSMPHPSITGLASGALIAKALNEGASPGTTVIGALTEGNLELAGRRFLDYAPALVTSKQGQKTLVAATGIAILGAFVRKQVPNVKLGGSKLYARI